VTSTERPEGRKLLNKIQSVVAAMSKATAVRAKRVEKLLALSRQLTNQS
jgi:hypothetical protein